MAGVAGKSGGPRKNAGGARPGAGRKPKPKQEAAVTGYSDPLDFLRAVWKGEVEATAAQVRAAQAALPFIHQKLGEGGKKEQREDAAKKVASRFAPAAPPKLVAAGGKKV
ncbi:hypothetical protein SAMN06295970_11785 [Noviherbaspirillum suwonense]|uniref:Uncharacterized protein n=1 Tax=Noviherbaspirillum suwonense TaxID=1224511 RepID=A0ABY1QHV8_9BURK|nr:hypothetical protein SAMN06295970_11785 [Noviherbaspirillum suwonense]